MYTRRVLDKVLDEFFFELPAILLDGPKGVGKTTTAKQRAQTVVQMDVDADYERATAQSDWVVSGSKPILIDEWHRLPSTWDSVKRAVDRDYSGGQYLLTGSLPTNQTHSGAGRIISIRMRPMSLAEREVTSQSILISELLEGTAKVEGQTTFSIDDYRLEIMRSGFPGIRQLSERGRTVAINGYIQRILDSDVVEMGVAVRKPATLLSWMKAYAAATGTTSSWETIRDAANAGFDKTPSRSTVLPFRDSLTRLRILDELEGWIPSRNTFGKVSLASKHYLADPALAVGLLEIRESDLDNTRVASEFDGPLFGRLFEALAVQSIRVYAEGSNAKAYHFRDRDGRHEIDMIIEGEGRRILAVEIKLSTYVKDSDLKHLKWLKEKLGDQVIDLVVIYAGAHAYRHDGVAVIPLALLGP